MDTHCGFVPPWFGRKAPQDALGRVRLLIVPAPERDAALTERLRADRALLLGEDVRVSVERVAEIPCEPSGKRPIIKACTVPSGAANERR